MTGFFQILKRNNDRNGNPYRLIAVYDGSASLVKVIESRSSRPNSVGELVRSGYAQIGDVYVGPSEYNDWRLSFKHILERE